MGYSDTIKEQSNFVYRDYHVTSTDNVKLVLYSTLR